MWTIENRHHYDRDRLRYRFIEDNWVGGERVQPGGSFDTIAGTLANMFDFDRHDTDSRRLFVDETTGVVTAAFPGDDRGRD
jgi:hypothetical protein